MIHRSLGYPRSMPAAPGTPRADDGGSSGYAMMGGMGAEHDMAISVLEESHRTFMDNIAGLALDEVLDAAGGYRSILGLMKHVAGWSAVYRSFAFDATPRHWDDTDWPRDLRSLIEPSRSYVDDVVSWFERTYSLWIEAVKPPADLGEPRPVHWGSTAPLQEIVAMVAAHWAYHAGEINQILALRRQEAWEYTEEVEENHIPSAGHGVRPDWMSDEEAARYQPEG
jgi:hypothetical protein